MTRILFALSVVVVAGAAVVLNADPDADTDRIIQIDQTEPPADPDVVRLVEDARRELERTRQLREEIQRQLDVARELTRQVHVPRNSFESSWAPLTRQDSDRTHSLSLIVPAAHIHPVIRRELGWTGPNEPWPPTRR